MDQEHINCTKGEWIVIKELGVLAVKNGVNLANFNTGDISREEKYFNLLLASSSKLMCKRINQVSELLQKQIETDEIYSTLKKDQLKLWQSLLQTSMPEELQIQGYRTNTVDELLKNIKYCMSQLNAQEKEKFKEELFHFTL